MLCLAILMIIGLGFPGVMFLYCFSLWLLSISFSVSVIPSSKFRNSIASYKIFQYINKYIELGKIFKSAQ